MRLRITGFLLCIFFAGPALAQAQQASPEPAAQEASEQAAQAGAAAPEDQNATEVPAPAASAPAGKVGLPAEGKGQVVFFRPNKNMGAAIGFKVREGSTELGKLRNGNYLIASVEPGTHEYTVHSEAKDILTLEVEAGETYYVQATITMGFMAGRPNLSPSDEAAFKIASRKMSLAK